MSNGIKSLRNYIYGVGTVWAFAALLIAVALLALVFSPFDLKRVTRIINHYF